MAILTNHVTIKWCNSTKRYYESLGYVFTRKGDVFSVLVEQLPPGSGVVVEASCDGCGAIRSTQFYRADCLCPSCAHRTPEALEQASQRMKALWANERDRVVAGQVKYWETADDRKNDLRERTERLRETTEYREKTYKHGPEHHQWKPELTEAHRRGERLIPGYTEWRKSVYERDHYTCAACGKVGGDLHAHHLYNYSNHEELQTCVENGVTLCEPCHRALHTRYGTKNNNPEQFYEFRQEKSVPA